MDTSDDSAEVSIQVYVNNYDEEYIKNYEFEDGTKVSDYDYKIEYVSTNQLTRDPAYLGTYFNVCMWITRDGVISLSLDPTNAVRTNSTEKENAWTILKSPVTGVGGSSNWPTDSQKQKTFKWQYDCHFSFAKDKDRWNLEPSRSASNYAAVVLAKCNP